MSATRTVLGILMVLAMAAGADRAFAQTTGGKAQYVAMGSSFAAGPGIIPHLPGNPPACARSMFNYAHVLANLRGLSLVDATCSGATTVDVLRPGQYHQPAQLDAVNAQTQLVTLTIGGNDVFFMSNLIAMSCGAPGGCPVRPEVLVQARFASLGNAMRKIVAGARRRSPAVRVVLVNYFTVLPDEGTCAAVGLTAEQATQVRAVARRLADITRQVAEESKADLLDVASLSHGHDACSSDPWVQGAHPPPGETIPAFHPTRAAMQAVGEALAKML